MNILPVDDKDGSIHSSVSVTPSNSSAKTEDSSGTRSELTEDQKSKALKNADYGAKSFQLGKYAAAVDCYSRALRDIKNIEYYLMRGEAQLKMGNCSDAREDANLSLSMDANSAEGYLLRGRSFTGYANFEEAEEQLQKAIYLAKKHNQDVEKFEQYFRENIAKKLISVGCGEAYATQVSLTAPNIEEARDKYYEHTSDNLEDKDDASSVAPSILNDREEDFTANRVSQYVKSLPRPKQVQAPESKPRFYENNGKKSSYVVKDPASKTRSNADTKSQRSFRSKKSNAIGRPRQSSDENRKDKSDGDSDSKLSTKTGTTIRSQKPQRNLSFGNTNQTNGPRKPFEDRTARNIKSGNGSVSNFSVKSGASFKSAFNPAQSSSYIIREKDRALPENVIGYHGLYVKNLSRAVDRNLFRKLFGEFGYLHLSNFRLADSSTNAAFVHYDNKHSPALAIQRYQGVNVKGLSHEDSRLIIKFIPGKGQEHRRLVNTGPDAQRIWTSKECYHWRNNGCDRTIRKCNKLHLATSLGIDYQPWMMTDIKI